MSDIDRAPDGDGIPRFRTERLLLRGWRDADLDPYAALNADPEVAEFLSTPLDREQSAAMISRVRAHWRNEGFGLFAVERLDDGAFLGFCGVTTLAWAPDPVPEIGWRLARDAWGRGYATEASREAMRFAFADRGIDELVSYTHVDNARSRRVMEKLGMARRDPAAPYDFLHPRLPGGDPLRPTVTYRLSRAGWLDARRDR
jgi:ribosomal-protein-alanine N-acetyltransferase